MADRRSGTKEKIRLPSRRATESLPDDLYFFEDELDLKEVLTANVITCAGWLLEIFDLRSGELFFVSGKQEIFPPGKCFGVFYPPFTVTRPHFKNAAGRVIGIAGTNPLPENIDQTPFVFEAAFVEPPKTMEKVVEVLISAENRRPVEASPKASLLSRKAKRLIDENFHVFPSIARIADRLGVSHEHLTRQFKNDFGLAPGAYLHQIRIAAATWRLSRGEKIINVSGDVGYNDLSRFYKQFRKATTKSPGFCQSALKAENVKN